MAVAIPVYSMTEKNTVELERGHITVESEMRREYAR